MREFTVKDLAKILGVSKPTIQRAINAAAIEASREDTQTRYYDIDAAALISAKVKPDFDFLACVGVPEQLSFDAPHTDTEPKQTAETQFFGENEPPHTDTEPKQTATPTQSESIEFMRAMLTTIQEQLASKDRQIAAYEAQIAMQNEQIKDYSERLKEALNLTRGQQYIAAANKTAELLEAAGNQEEDRIVISSDGDNVETAVPAKKSFWKKLFGKE